MLVVAHGAIRVSPEREYVELGWSSGWSTSSDSSTAPLPKVLAKYWLIFSSSKSESLSKSSWVNELNY